MKRFIDIGVNLTDSMFKGVYGRSKKHQEDLMDVIERAFSNGMEKMIITGGSLSESEAAIKLSRSDTRLYSTVGCHPTRTKEFENEPDAYYSKLKELILNNRDKVVALGECGLDYDREKFSPRSTQLVYFEKQCQLAAEVKLPLFLHCRAAHDDFIQVLKKYNDSLCSGVVHTFDGNLETANELISMGYYLGLNGCSMKTEEHLNVVKDLPVDRLLLETDAPWCDIRPTHVGYKYIKTKFPSVKKEKWQADSQIKSRNEPVNIIQVLEVVAAAKGLDENILADKAYTNTMALFFPDLSTVSELTKQATGDS